jgi:hypothetical protein
MLSNKVIAAACTLVLSLETMEAWSIPRARVPIIEGFGRLGSLNPRQHCETTLTPIVLHRASLGPNKARASICNEVGAHDDRRAPALVSGAVGPRHSPPATSWGRRGICHTSLRCHTSGFSQCGRNLGPPLRPVRALPAFWPQHTQLRPDPEEDTVRAASRD